MESSLDLSGLFRWAGLTLTDIAVMFHVSDKPALHRALPVLAAEEPALFDAFQNQHGPNVEATLLKRPILASFVPLQSGEHAFAGMFAVWGARFATWADLAADPRRQVLTARYGDTDWMHFGLTSDRSGRHVFDLVPMSVLTDLTGRLICHKPAGRHYRYLAENLSCPVLEIARRDGRLPPPPDWRDFIVTAADLRALPRDWSLRLAGWRGVYLITDERDGSRYVGSAWGQENLLGRWQEHVTGERGVTVELRGRDTASFRFSILQLLLHDAGATEVQALETNWKHRLHTRKWGLNRN